MQINSHYNFIDQRYHLTPALNFILTAQEHPEIPFFMTLDEMNLSKVEHYFSDFLSCLESRHFENGNLMQEPIHLHSDSGWLDTNNEYFDTIGPKLTLPPNLFVTGTVNIDESTYMFSSKVLDRANVIELNKVDIAGYAGNAAAEGASTFLLNHFPDFSEFELPRPTDFRELPRTTREFLISVHGILSKYNLHFGYRVINEVASFILNTQKYCEQHPQLIDQAVDRQLVQKILPKLNGTQSKLDECVRELLALLSTGNSGPPMDAEEVQRLVTAQTRFPLASEKLKRMSRELTLNGFANFIE
jgi:5-methylcytosine-specific restriction endonuclease McrBC GTP-binding regulatory subunit McrB